MMVDIDATGKVTKVEVTKPVGQGFDEAARDGGDAVPVLARGDRRQAVGDPDRVHAALRSQAGSRRTRASPTPPPPTPVDAARRRPRRPRPSSSRSGACARRGRAIRCRAARSRSSCARPKASTSRRWSWAAPTPRAASRSRASRAPALRVIVTEPRHEPCIRDLAAGRRARRASATELDCLVPKSGAPSLRNHRPLEEAAAGGDALRAVAARAEGRPGHVRRSAARRAEPTGRGAHAVRAGRAGDPRLLAQRFGHLRRGPQDPDPVSLPDRARRAGAAS